MCVYWWLIIFVCMASEFVIAGAHIRIQYTHTHNHMFVYFGAHSEVTIIVSCSLTIHVFHYFVYGLFCVFADINQVSSSFFSVYYVILHCVFIYRHIEKCVFRYRIYLVKSSRYKYMVVWKFKCSQLSGNTIQFILVFAFAFAFSLSFLCSNFTWLIFRMFSIIWLE